MAIVGRSIPNVPIVSRGSLVDDPVLTTPKPIVVTGPTRARTAVVITSRSSLVDVAAPASDTTPGPVVVVPRGRARPGSVITVRAALADDPVLTTPRPIVLTPLPQPRRGYVATVRGSLFDAATPQPLVVTPRPAARRNPPAIVFAAPAADTASPAVATPQLLVVIGAARRRPLGSVLVLRAALGGETPPPTPGTAISFDVGRPEPRWIARPPDGGWDAGHPAAAWTTSPPEA